MEERWSPTAPLDAITLTTQHREVGALILSLLPLLSLTTTKVDPFQPHSSAAVTPLEKLFFFSFLLLLLFPPSFKILSQALVLPPFCLYSLSPTIHNAGPLWVITGHFSKRYRCHVAAVYWYIYAHGLCQRNNSEPMRSVWLIDCLWLLWIWFKQQEWNDQYNSRDPPLRELLWTTLLGFCPTLKLLPRSYIFGQLCLNGSIWQD